MIYFAYPDWNPPNIPDYKSGISKFKNLSVDFDENLGPCQKWAKLPSYHVRNGQNYQVTTLFCLSGPVSGKYSGLVVLNVQTQKITYFWILMKISGNLEAERITSY